MLLEHVAVGVLAGIGGAEIHQAKVPRRIPLDGFIVLQHVLGHVAMVIHQALGAELLAFRTIKAEILVAAGLLAVTLEPLLVVVQQALSLMRSQAVRPAVDLHLKQAKVKAHLNLDLAVVAANPPDGDLARLIRPIVQNFADVHAHIAV